MKYRSSLWLSFRNKNQIRQNDRAIRQKEKRKWSIKFERIDDVPLLTNVITLSHIFFSRENFDEWNPNKTSKQKQKPFQFSTSTSVDIFLVFRIEKFPVEKFDLKNQSKNIFETRNGTMRRTGSLLLRSTFTREIHQSIEE